MKKTRMFFAIAGLMAVVSFTSCKKEELEPVSKDLPQQAVLDSIYFKNQNLTDFFIYPDDGGCKIEFNPFLTTQFEEETVSTIRTWGGNKTYYPFEMRDKGNNKDYSIRFQHLPPHTTVYVGENGNSGGGYFPFGMNWSNSTAGELTFEMKELDGLYELSKTDSGMKLTQTEGKYMPNGVIIYFH